MANTTLNEHGDGFLVLDMIASFRFKSAGSVSFALGTYGDVLNFPAEGVSIHIGPGGVFNGIGWLDLHYPCEGHIKAIFRVLLPARYHSWEQMHELVERVFSVLGIAADETYEASFVSAEQETGIVQAKDRDGMTDRF